MKIVAPADPTDLTGARVINWMGKYGWVADPVVECDGSLRIKDWGLSTCIWVEARPFTVFNVAAEPIQQCNASFLVCSDTLYPHVHGNEWEKLHRKIP